MHRAATLLQHAKAALERTQPELMNVTVAGDFRRGCELIADLALVAETPGQEKLAMLDASNLKVYVADRKHLGAALLHATGSPEHLEQLRALAEKKGMRLDPNGLHRGRRVVAAKEADIYRALGLLFIEPELREGRGEIERALKGKQPQMLPTRTSTAFCTVIRTPPTAPRR